MLLAVPPYKPRDAAIKRSFDQLLSHGKASYLAADQIEGRVF